MKFTVSALAAAAAVCVFANDVQAQAYPQGPPPPPPSSDNSDPNTVANDVSTLNGQLVEVGDKNRFRTGHKQWNIAANPFGFLFNWYSLSGSKALSDNIALRGEVSFSTDNDSSAVGLGVGLPLYFKKVYTGLFLEPGLTTFASGDETIWAGPQLVIGYHWYWDSNLNLAVAAGVGRNWSSEDEFTETFPAGYFQVGYAFGD